MRLLSIVTALLITALSQDSAAAVSIGSAFAAAMQTVAMQRDAAETKTSEPQPQPREQQKEPFDKNAAVDAMVDRLDGGPRLRDFRTDCEEQ